MSERIYKKRIKLPQNVSKFEDSEESTQIRRNVNTVEGTMQT